jgi:hypothetical protein
MGPLENGQEEDCEENKKGVATEPSFLTFRLPRSCREIQPASAAPLVQTL